MRAHLRFIGAAAIATSVTAMMPVHATAEDYPSRTVSLVVAFPAGGGVDTVGRVVAQKLTEALGQQVIVVNRPGAGSVIGTRDVARAQADGYTLLLLVTGAGLPENPVTTWARTSRRSDLSRRCRSSSCPTRRCLRKQSPT